MNSMAGIKVLHVPYRGSAPAVTDVAGGVVTMSFSSLAAALPLIKAGKLRAVAVTSKERMPQLPDVEPLSSGDPKLAGYELLNWFGLFAPARTPRPVLETLNREANAGLTDKTLADKLMVQGIVPRPLTLDEAQAFVRSESKKFAQIAKAAHIEVSN
jgi:tripartite-type tricarboxylate transporter receptor subunit TctC